MKKLESMKARWDTTEEEEMRVFLPANDCRRFNGGEVASKRIRETWGKPRVKSATRNEVRNNGTEPVVIDRLRD